jgi:hypothetical protein
LAGVAVCAAVIVVVGVLGVDNAACAVLPGRDEAVFIGVVIVLGALLFGILCSAVVGLLGVAADTAAAAAAGLSV